MKREARVKPWLSNSVQRQKVSVSSSPVLVTQQKVETTSVVKKTEKAGCSTPIASEDPRRFLVGVGAVVHTRESAYLEGSRLPKLVCRQSGKASLERNRWEKLAARPVQQPWPLLHQLRRCSRSSPELYQLQFSEQQVRSLLLS